jgi:hypothetical protein
MKSSCFSIFFVILFNQNLFSQDTTLWSILRKGEAVDYLATIVSETDSFYFTFSRSIDTFGLVEQGFSISKIDKKSGDLMKSKHFEEKGEYLDFTGLRKVIMEENYFIFSQENRFRDTSSIYLFKTDIKSLETKKILQTKSHIDSLYIATYLTDLIAIGDYYYVLVAVGYFDESNDPQLQGLEPTIFKVNRQTKEFKVIKVKEKSSKIEPYKFIEYNGGILLVSSYRVGEEVITGGQLITQLDLEGNILWEYKSPAEVRNYYATSIYPINDKEILIGAADGRYNYETYLSETRSSVMRFNTETKKIKYYTWWGEPWKPFQTTLCKIVKGHKPSEYLLMDGNYRMDGNFTEGRVVKFDAEGKRLWKKSYAYFPQNSVFNDFRDMIPTTDGNYLICGTNGLGRSIWLVKIDDDGNILPIDTTTATAELEIAEDIDVCIYPNPTDDRLIIAQGDVSDVLYTIYDLQGKQLKQVEIKESQTQAIWDLGDMVNGIYNIVMTQDGKIVGSSKIVVKK